MKQVIAIALMIIAGQAHAWGDREQGILAGVFGTILLQKIAQQNQQPVYGQPPVSVGEAPVYSDPQVIVQQQPRVIVVPQHRPRYDQQPRMYIPAPQNRCEVVPMYDHWGRYVGQQTVCNW
jgi:hypothetical protein